MVSALRESAHKGELRRLTDPPEIDRVLDELMATPWVVYAKPCLNHTRSVLDYLGRYTHRIAITNARILAVDEHGVVIRYKDYRDSDKTKTIRLAGPEFVRRYLLHILPQGFTRIRHYGFLANRCRVQKLARIREVLTAHGEITPDDKERAYGDDRPGYPCPVCKRGRMHVIDIRPANVPCRSREVRRR